MANSLITLRKSLPFNEFDYQALSNALKDYAQIRSKIQQLLKTGAIIRIKKGLYVFGPELTQGLISKELLANWIYGPSYLSLEYALSFHHMIPERVYTLTSVTTKKNKHFKTPLGEFSYGYLNQTLYPLGITSVSIDSQRNILIATPEKALIDTLYFSNITAFKNDQDIETWLLEDQRINPEILATLDISLLSKWLPLYARPTVRALIQWICDRAQQSLFTHE